jgi:hypothetical protein
MHIGEGENNRQNFSRDHFCEAEIIRNKKKKKKKKKKKNLENCLVNYI